MLREIGDYLSEVTAGGRIISKLGANSVDLFCVFGTVERVNVQLVERAEQAGHAADFAGLAAFIIRIDSANAFIYRDYPVEIIFEIPSDRSVLVSVTSVEGSVILPAER